MTDEDFIRLAIDQAELSHEPLRCGVVIVKDGDVIAHAYNSQRKDTNASAHAEIKAVALAGKKLKNKNLAGCVVYCTCEPCVMCLAALVYAKIDRLVFGAALSDFGAAIDIDYPTVLQKANHKIEVTGGILADECRKISVG